MICHLRNITHWANGHACKGGFSLRADLLRAIDLSCVCEQTSSLLKCSFGVALDGADLQRDEVALQVVLERQVSPGRERTETRSGSSGTCPAWLPWRRDCSRCTWRWAALPCGRLWQSLQDRFKDYDPSEHLDNLPSRDTPCWSWWRSHWISSPLWGISLYRWHRLQWWAPAHSTHRRRGSQELLHHRHSRPWCTRTQAGDFPWSTTWQNLSGLRASKVSIRRPWLADIDGWLDTSPCVCHVPGRPSQFKIANVHDQKTLEFLMMKDWLPNVR